jgi:hypothetical protein
MGTQSDATKCMALALLNLADDEGYFYAESNAVRSFARPFDDDSTTSRECLDKLSKIGFIEIVIHPTRGPVGKVVNFCKHQRIDKAKPSEIKEYFRQSNSGRISRPIDDDSTTSPQGLGDDSCLEGKGREREGREGERKGEGPSPEPEELASSSACASKLMDALLISGWQNRIVCEEAILRCAKHRTCSPMEATNHLLTQARLYQASEQYASQWRKGWVKWLAGGHWNETLEHWKEQPNDPDPVPPPPKGRSLRERIRRQRAGLDPDGPEPNPAELKAN